MSGVILAGGQVVRWNCPAGPPVGAALVISSGPVMVVAVLPVPCSSCSLLYVSTHLFGCLMKSIPLYCPRHKEPVFGKMDLGNQGSNCTVGDYFWFCSVFCFLFLFCFCSQLLNWEVRGREIAPEELKS